MKIIFLEAVQNHGGARMSTLNLAHQMKSLGHQVLIIDLWGADENFNNQVNELNLKYNIINPNDKPFVIYDPNKFKHLKNIYEYYKIQKYYKAEIQKIIDDFKPDVVSVNNIKCLNLLNPKGNYNIDFFVRTWFSRKEIDFKTRHFLNKYKPRYLCVSQSTRQAVFNSGLAELNEIHVLHDVINDDEYFNYTPNIEYFNEKRPIRLLHSGGLLESKGQHIAIYVAKKLKENNIPFKLTLTAVVYVGAESENYLKRIKDLILEYDLSDDIELILNSYNVLQYFKYTDILIHSSYTEGLPRVALEALSYGKPVIANPVGGVTDVIINNFTGFITDFNEVDQYVTSIRKYFNQDTYKQHSQNCRHLIMSEYLLKNRAEMISKIYPY